MRTATPGNSYESREDFTTPLRRVPARLADGETCGCTGQGDRAVDCLFRPTRAPTDRSYNWNFGDGTTGRGGRAVHTYSAAHTPYASVTNAADHDRLRPLQRSLHLHGRASPAWTSMRRHEVGGVDISSPTEPNDGPWSWTLNWGDGSTQTGSAAVEGQTLSFRHTYSAVGTYTVRFTVTDKDAGSASSTLKAIISTSAAPPAVLVGAGDIGYCSGNGDEQTARS